MSVNNKWLPLATLGAGVLLGWLGTKVFSKRASVMQLNETAPAVVINGRTWSYLDLPAELRTRIHIAFLQANGHMRVALEDFAARVSRSGGKPDTFDWDKEAAARVTESSLRSIFENAIGFKNQGTFDSPKVQQALKKYAIDRERSILVAEELNKLVKEKRLQIVYDLPLGAALEEDLSVYPVLEVGPEGKPVGGEFQVMFNYSQPYSDSVFNLIQRLADQTGQRLKIRLLSEYGKQPNEKLAIETIGCVLSGPFKSNEVFSVHLRLLQEIPNLKSENPKLDWTKAFAGNADLARRIEACPLKSFPEDAYAANAMQWQKIRQNPLPVIFNNSRRLSEYDPRGIDELLRLALLR